MSEVMNVGVMNVGQSKFQPMLQFPIFPERKSVGNGWAVLEPGGAPGGYVLLQAAHHDDRQ